MRRQVMAMVAIFTLLTVAAADDPPRDRFTVRCLNKDSVVKYDRSGKLNIELELTVTLGRELRLKPRDFRLWMLDAQLRQLDGVAVALPEEWEKKTFKKGETRDTLTVQVPAPGEFEEGKEYHVAILLVNSLRFVKFKVGKSQR